MNSQHPETNGPHGRPVQSPVFATTHWSVVLAAGDKQSPQAAQALETLCRAYWYPLYSYARRRGYAPEDAQDLTQEFFAQLLRKNYPARADRAKGRFRTFLLHVLSQFLLDQRERAATLKRGGDEYKEHDWDLEVCEPIDEDVNESARVKVRTLPASTLACTLHNGPFTTIGEAYNAIGKWSTDNGYRITGPCREVYLHPSKNGSQTETETVTEIQFPVEKI